MKVVHGNFSSLQNDRGYQSKRQLHKLTLPVNFLLYQLYMNVRVTEHSWESYKVFTISSRDIPVHSTSWPLQDIYRQTWQSGTFIGKRNGQACLTSYLIFAAWPTNQIVTPAIFRDLCHWSSHHYVVFKTSSLCCRGRGVRGTSVKMAQTNISALDFRDNQMDTVSDMSAMTWHGFTNGSSRNLCFGEKGLWLIKPPLQHDRIFLNRFNLVYTYLCNFVKSSLEFCFFRSNGRLMSPA